MQSLTHIRRHRLVTRVACIAALLLTVVPLAGASVITFAQFHESATTNANLFDYVNNTTSAVFDTNPGTLGAGIPVVFSYETVNGVLPADLQGPQNAILTLTSNTSLPAVQVTGSIATEQIGTTSSLAELTITRTTPAAEGGGNRTNLLSMAFDGTLLGMIGGVTPQFSGNSNLGNTVTYSSDFLNFSSSTEQNFSLTYTSWTTNSSDSNNGLGLEIGPGSFFEPATATGAGTFDASSASVVPEPATLALAFTTIFPLLARRPRRR